MVDKALELISAEWKLCLFFILIILLLGILSLFYLEGIVFKIILFCIGLDAYIGFFIALGKILKGERVENPYKYVFFGKDKNRYDFIILFAFFSAIILIFKGPMILFQTLLANTFKDVLLAIGQWMILINIFVLMCFTAYKIVIYSAFANLTYHRNEVMDAFKAGIKGIWHFKVILLLFILFDILASIYVPLLSDTIKNAYTLVNFLVPGLIMLLMISYYNSVDSAENEAEHIVNENN